MEVTTYTGLTVQHKGLLKVIEIEIQKVHMGVCARVCVCGVCFCVHECVCTHVVLSLSLKYRPPSLKHNNLKCSYDQSQENPLYIHIVIIVDQKLWWECRTL